MKVGVEVAGRRRRKARVLAWRLWKTVRGRERAGAVSVWGLCVSGRRKKKNIPQPRFQIEKGRTPKGAPKGTPRVNPLCPHLPAQDQPRPAEREQCQQSRLRHQRRIINFDRSCRDLRPI